MNWLMTMLLGNTLLALLLAAAAMGASMLRRPAVAHVLWAIVLLKLITPALLRVELPAWGIGRNDASDTITAAVATLPAAEVARAVNGAAPDRAVAQPRLEVADARARRVDERAAVMRVPRAAVELTNSPSHTTRRRTAPDPATLLLAVWGLGSLALIARELINWRRLAQIRRRSQPAPCEFTRLVADVAGRLRLARLPDVRTLAGEFSPLVLPAVGRAVLIVPESLTRDFSAEQQRAIAAHELAHLVRGDHLIRVPEALAAALMWWHPLMWLARRGLREAEEQCCDAWVVALLPEARRTYADALVDVLERAASAAATFAPRPTGLATGLGPMKHLRRRLTMIIDGTPPKSLSWSGKIMAALLVALLPLAPVRGGDGPKSSPARAASDAAATKSAPADDATRKAVEALLEMAADSNEQARMAAAEAIARFGPRAVPALIDALARDATADAARTLLPRTGVEGIEALIDAVSAEDPAVRERALLALETVLGAGSNQLVSAEGAFAGAPGMYVGAGAQGFAPAMGGGMSALPPPQFTSYATWAIAPAAKASVDANPAVRRAAVRVLAAISRLAADPSVAKALGAALKDSDASVRGLSAAALVNIARAAPEVSAALAAAVGDSDQNVRIAALSALGSLGPAAKDAMPTVTAALKDLNPAVRIAAANALGAMQAPPQPPSGQNPFGAADEGVAARDNAFVSAAQNLWHWTKLGRHDLAKAEAERILKLHVEPNTLYGVFAQIAQERNEDLKTWIARMKDVKEIKPLVEQLKATAEQIEQPQPAPAR